MIFGLIFQAVSALILLAVCAGIYRFSKAFPAASASLAKGLFALGCVGAVLMVVVVYPSFRQLMTLSTHGAMKGHLGALREEFKVYRAETSENPPDLAALAARTQYKKLYALWGLGAQPHKKTAEVILLADGKPTDSGKWAYAVGTSTPIFIDCTHTDSKGWAWASY